MTATANWLCVGTVAVACLVGLVRWLGNTALVLTCFLLAVIAFLACTIAPTNEIAAAVALLVFAVLLAGCALFGLPVQLAVIGAVAVLAVYGAAAILEEAVRVGKLLGKGNS